MVLAGRATRADALGRVATVAAEAVLGVRVTPQGGAKLAASYGRAFAKVEVNTIRIARFKYESEA